jgi:hypothetical protein
VRRGCSNALLSSIVWARRASDEVVLVRNGAASGQVSLQSSRLADADEIQYEYSSSFVDVMPHSDSLNMPTHT